MAEEVAPPETQNHSSAMIAGSTIKVRPRNSTTRIAEPTETISLPDANSAFHSSDPSLT
jgi:hypothetical protein